MEGDGMPSGEITIVKGGKEPHTWEPTVNRGM